MPLMAARNLPYQQALRETLGRQAFDALWQEGRALNTVEARALGLEENAENEEDAAPQVQVLAEGAERPAEAAGERAKARALCSAGRLAWFGGDFLTARARLEEGLALLRAAGDVPGVVSAMSSLIMVLSWQGEEERALSLVRESCELVGRVPDRAGLLPVLGALGYALHTLSSTRAQGEVRAINEEVVRLARAAGNARALAVAQGAWRSTPTGPATSSARGRSSRPASLRCASWATLTWSRTRCGAWVASPSRRAAWTKLSASAAPQSSCAGATPAPSACPT
jgi:hypothetical protein